MNLDLRSRYRPIGLDDPLEAVLRRVAEALGKRVGELVVVMLNRPRHEKFVREVRRVGAALRLIGDGDITAAVAPSLPDTGVARAAERLATARGENRPRSR